MSKNFPKTWARNCKSRTGRISVNCMMQVVGVPGFEPGTLRLSSACSNQLSYTPNGVGGAEETRTPDL